MANYTQELIDHEARKDKRRGEATTCAHSASYIKGKEMATNMEIRCAICDLATTQALAHDLYEALRSMGDIHCACPDCQAERSNAMRAYESSESDAATQPSTYKDALPGQHHSRCHTQMYGSNEMHCDCGFTKIIGPQPAAENSGEAKHG